MPSFCRLALPARRILVFCSFSSCFPGQKQTTNQQKLYWNEGLRFWGGLLIHAYIPSSKVSWDLLGGSSGVRAKGARRTCTAMSPGDPASCVGGGRGR